MREAHHKSAAEDVAVHDRFLSGVAPVHPEDIFVFYQQMQSSIAQHVPAVARAWLANDPELS